VACDCVRGPDADTRRQGNDALAGTSDANSNAIAYPRATNAHGHADPGATDPDASTADARTCCARHCNACAGCTCCARRAS
jgi:hypothetical protein